MSEDERADEQPVINTQPPDEQPPPQITITPPLVPPMADSYRSAGFRAWVREVNVSYLQRQYAARHINRT